MPTNRTRRTRSRANAIDHWKLDDLVTGDCFLGAGYAPANNRNGCGSWTPEEWAEVHAAMRADWAIWGDEIMAWWRGENERWTRWDGSDENQRDKLHYALSRHGGGETLPFAAREFGGAQ